MRYYMLALDRRWLVMGVQGALLSLLIAEPIKFKSIVIGAGSPFSLESMRRGLYGRFNSTAITAIPDILGANDVLRFCHRKSATRARPCASSVIWCDVPDSKRWAILSCMHAKKISKSIFHLAFLLQYINAYTLHAKRFIV